MIKNALERPQNDVRDALYPIQPASDILKKVEVGEGEGDQDLALGYLGNLPSCDILLSRKERPAHTCG